MKVFMSLIFNLLFIVSIQADWKIANDALKASDESSGDWFGYSVDIGDSYAVVGAPSASMGGAIYIFKKDLNNNWIEMQKVEAVNALVHTSSQFDNSDTATLAAFGADVAISDTYTSDTIPFTIIVGAPSTLVEHDSIDVSTGAFCIYELNTSTTPFQWQQHNECMIGIVFSTDGSTPSALGSSVDVSIWSEGLNKYGRIIVGDPLYDQKHTDIGMAIFFRYGASTWSASGITIGQGGATGASDIKFGQSVAVDKHSAVIGAPGYNILDPNDNDPDVVEIIHEVGAAHFFTSLGTYVNTYTPPHEETVGGHNFGMNVDIHGDYSIVAEKHREGGTSDAAAYIMKRGLDGNWTQHNYIENGSRGYGQSVAINDTHAAVSAFNPQAVGSVYMYKKDTNGDWNTNEPFYIFDIAKSSAYGIDVALYEDELIVGAPLAEEVKQYKNDSEASMNPAIIMYLLN